MEINASDENDYFDVFFYTKQVKSNDKQVKNICLICLLDETDDGKEWDRLILKCGHACHSRCLRMWCGFKKCVNCPLCGDIPEIKQNRYCNECDNFGHSLFDDCPTHEKYEQEYLQNIGSTK